MFSVQGDKSLCLPVSKVNTKLEIVEWKFIVVNGFVKGNLRYVYANFLVAWGIILGTKWTGVVSYFRLKVSKINTKVQKTLVNNTNWDQIEFYYVTASYYMIVTVC